MKRTLSYSATIAAAMTVALLAGGCARDYAEDSRAFADQTDDFLDNTRIVLGGWTQERMLKDGWLKAPPEPEQRAWCYRTLAGIDCHDGPVPGQDHRLTVPPAGGGERAPAGTPQ